MRRVLTIGVVTSLVCAIGALGAWTALSVSSPGASGQVGASGGQAASEVPPASPAEAVAIPACRPDASLVETAAEVPDDLRRALERFTTDPVVAEHASGVSVWVDGYGEVLAHEPDRLLAPASNQKLFTAVGALAVIGGDQRLTTEVLLTPGGDLVVVGGGDPTLTTIGPHSLAALAGQVRDAGITDVPGALIVDESRHDGTRRASGWFDWQIPAHTGPMSAFMVDRNRWRGDPAFLADPALANLERLRAQLGALGVTIAGATGYAPGPVTGRPVAAVESAPIAELVGDVLRSSDNQVADLLIKEVGSATGGAGSVAAATIATEAELAGLCLGLEGAVDDGSGLSRSNLRSAREWRVLLQAIRTEPWFASLLDGLPVAARTGTLASRFGGTAAAGNVRAKTGTIVGGTALSGYGTTASGRSFVFSVVVNGEGARGAVGAVDRFVSAVAAHAG